MNAQNTPRRFQKKDCYDCGFTFIREKFKEHVTPESRRSLLKDSTGLIARMTVLCMFVSGSLDLFVEILAELCGNEYYNVTSRSKELLFSAVFLAVVLTSCKCGLGDVGNSLARCFALLGYNVGTVAFFIYFTQPPDSSCSVYGYRQSSNQPSTGNHDPFVISWTPRRREPWIAKKICPSYENNCAVQFLMDELDILIYCCIISWFLCFSSTCGYVVQAFKSIENLTPSSVLSPLSMSPGPSVLSPEPRVYFLHVIEEEQEPSSSEELVTYGSPSSASAAQLPQELEDPTTNKVTKVQVHSLPKDKSATDVVISYESVPVGLHTFSYELRIRKDATYIPETKTCSLCKGFQGFITVDRETQSLTSFPVESSGKFSAVSEDPMIHRKEETPQKPPKYCRNCGARF